MKRIQVVSDSKAHRLPMFAATAWDVVRPHSQAHRTVDQILDWLQATKSLTALKLGKAAKLHWAKVLLGREKGRVLNAEVLDMIRESLRKCRL